MGCIIIDVGSVNHAVVIGDGRGNIIREFEITHTQIRQSFFYA